MDTVSLIDSNGSPQMCELWETDVALVRKLWAATDPYELCLKVIIGVLVNRPALLSNFGLVETTDMTVGELAKSPRLQSHANMIADFFSEMLESLSESIEKGEWLIQYVGAVHFKRSVNFTADNYLVFKQQFVQQLCASLPQQLNRSVSRSSLLRRAPKSTSALYGSALNGSAIRPLVSKRSCDDSFIVQQFYSTSVQTVSVGLGRTTTTSPRLESVAADRLAVWRLMNFVVRRLKDGFLTEAIRGAAGDETDARELTHMVSPQ